MQALSRHLESIIAASFAIAAATAAAYLDGGTTLVFARVSPSRVDARYTSNHWLDLSSVEEFDAPGINGVILHDSGTKFCLDEGDAPGDAVWFPGDRTTVSKVNSFLATSLVGQKMTIREYPYRILPILFLATSAFFFVTSYKLWPGDEDNVIPPTNSTTVAN